MTTGFLLMLVDYEYQDYINAGYTSSAPLAAFFSRDAAEKYIAENYPGAVYSSKYDEWVIRNIIIRIREIEMEGAHEH